MSWGSSVQSVSNPGPGYLLSVLSGLTQNETDTTWWADNIVGFNDSGSTFETEVAAVQISYGVARSTKPTRLLHRL